MIEQRIFCDKCGVECTESYIQLSPIRHSVEGTYTTKTSIDLCEACFSFCNQFLELEFSIPVEDETDYD